MRVRLNPPARAQLTAARNYIRTYNPIAAQKFREQVARALRRLGNFPGIEARIFGSEGAIMVRLVEEFGVCQTIKTARKGAVEFVEAVVPAGYFPAGGHSREPWDSLFYSGLVADFATEILDGGPVNQGDFAQGALVQQTINAFEKSFRTRAWASFPLDGGSGGR